MSDGTFQLLDGQQRTLSILLFREGQDTAKIIKSDDTFVGLDQSYKTWFDNYELTIFICEADKKNGESEKEAQERFETEMMEWFQIINIAGEPLKDQELRNATHFGEWVSSAKNYFSNEKSVIFKEKSPLS